MITLLLLFVLFMLAGVFIILATGIAALFPVILVFAAFIALDVIVLKRIFKKKDKKGGKRAQK